MNYGKATLVWEVLVMVAVSAACAGGAPPPLSFTYENGQMTADETRVHTAKVGPVAVGDSVRSIES